MGGVSAYVGEGMGESRISLNLIYFKAVPHTTAPTVVPPRSRAEIIAQFKELHQQSLRYWEAFDTTTFVTPFGVAWSPADHVRHLSKAMRALTRGLSLARFKLLIRFGWAFRPSRTYDQMRDTYLAVLPGFTGRNPFAPKPVDSIGDPVAYRDSVMLEYDAALQNLVTAIEPWSERSLDRYRMPHLVLGKLTVREMLVFVLYHNLHHMHVVARRSPELPAD